MAAAASTYYELVQSLYLAYYGRPADVAGQAFWATQIADSNGNLGAVINAFGTSAESTALYGAASTTAQVTAIYQQLFDRQPDSAGLSFYVNGIANGQFTLASVALNIYNGAAGTDVNELSAKLGYADAFTAALTASASAQTAYAGTAAANYGREAVAGVTGTASETAAIQVVGTTVADIGVTAPSGPSGPSGITLPGAPVVNLTLNVGSTNYQGGAGNDTFAGIFSNAAGGNTFLSTDTINGGGGINTLTINPAQNTASTLTDANFGNGTISNIQDLVFGNTGTGTLSLTTGDHFNADFSTVNLTASSTTGTLTLAMDTYVTAATLNTTSSTGSQFINIGTASGAATDSITAHSTTGSLAITVGNGADSIVAGSTTGAIVITAGNGVDSIGATATTGPITIHAGNGIDTISVTGTAGGSVTTITTGTGIDSVTASSVDAVTITSGSTTGDTLLSGSSSVSAALTINASGAATSGIYNITANATGGPVAINVSGGLGTEVYNITLGSHSGAVTISTSEIGTGAQATSGTYAANTIITGAQTGDVLQIFDASASGLSAALMGPFASVNAGILSAHASSTAGSVQTFTFNGNTYLVEDEVSGHSAATSTVVELVGIHTIGTVSGGHVTLAT